MMKVEGGFSSYVVVENCCIVIIHVSICILLALSVKVWFEQL